MLFAQQPDILDDNIRHHGPVGGSVQWVMTTVVSFFDFNNTAQSNPKR